MASDVRDFNRGCLVVGDGWQDFHQKKIIAPNAVAKPSDYRYVTHETIRLMFVEGVEWKKTPEYESFRTQLMLGKKPYGIETEDDLERRGSELVSLYKSIAAVGVKPAESVGSPRYDDAHFYLDRAGKVGLGRHANHRVAIARLLGIRWVPAIFGGVHMEYAARFDSDVASIGESCLFKLTEVGALKSIE